MPQFIYRLLPTRLEMLTVAPTEREAEVVRQHFEYLQGLTAAGVVLVAGRTQAAAAYCCGSEEGSSCHTSGINPLVGRAFHAQDSAVDGRQPSRSETNQTPAAADSPR